MSNFLITAQCLSGWRRNSVYPDQARAFERPPIALLWRSWSDGLDTSRTMTGGVKDAAGNQTLEGELTVPQRSLRNVYLGTVLRACTVAHMKVNVFNPDGSVVAPGLANQLLTPLKVYLRTEAAFIYYFRSQPALGIVFNVDLAGGEEISVEVDNNDARSMINGQTLQFNLMLNFNPRYQIEMERKGNPIT